MPTENQNCNSVSGQLSEELFEIHATGVTSPRNMGDIVEARFLAKAASMGFGVLRPFGTERYDFVLDSGHRLSRVQIKSNRGRPTGGYMVKVSGYKRVPYTKKTIDFLVVYLVPEDLWYIIPVEELEGHQCLCFFPHGRGTSQWEKYCGSWCQMACPNEENGPSKIVTPRCRDIVAAEKALCPLKVLR